jgi:hypothetical protein
MTTVVSLVLSIDPSQAADTLVRSRNVLPPSNMPNGDQCVGQGWICEMTRGLVLLLSINVK